MQPHFFSVSMHEEAHLSPVSKTGLQRPIVQEAKTKRDSYQGFITRMTGQEGGSEGISSSGQFAWRIGEQKAFPLSNNIAEPRGKPRAKAEIESSSEPL